MKFASFYDGNSSHGKLQEEQLLACVTIIAMMVKLHLSCTSSFQQNKIILDFG